MLSKAGQVQIRESFMSCSHLPAPLLQCTADNMKFTMISVGLLALFIASGFTYNINISDDNNLSGSGQQSVSVNNEHNVANVDNNNGWDSWNGLWDYQNSFAATRLFAKKMCIVHKMNKDAMPSIQALDALVKEKKLQGEGSRGSPSKELMYSINPNQVEDLNTFGPKIASMCQGLPTYFAEEVPGSNMPFYSDNCYTANILWILRLSFCKSTVEQF